MAKDTRLDLRVSAEEKAAIEAAAAAAGLVVSAWIRMVLKREAAKTVRKTQA